MPLANEIKDFEGLAEAVIESTKAAEKGFNDLSGKAAEHAARLDEMEQKMARRGGVSGANDNWRPTPGAQFIASDEVKSFTGNDVRPGRRISVETKAIISSLTTDADGSAGDLIVPYRDTLVGQPQRRLVMRDLIPTIQIDSNAVQYPKLSGFTNSAATVSETAGTEKPQSEMKFDIVTVNVTTLAHWVYAMRQVLDDAPQLKGLIDTELLYGLAYVEDNQILNGGGTGTDLNGIYTQATAMSANPMVVSSPTKIDVIGAAILQQNLTNLPADGIVMNPSDWTSIQLIKDTAGAYILGDPQSAVQPRLFGLPVVITPAMAADKFLIGSFRTSARLYDRWAARVEVSTEDGDNFRKNMITVLAEERIALAVTNTLGFTKGDFSDAITDLTS